MAWWEEKDKMTDTGLTVGQLFEQTYPGQGQQIWEQQSGAATPPSSMTQGSYQNQPNLGYTYGQGPALPPSSNQSITNSMGGQQPWSPPPSATDSGPKGSGQTVGVVNPVTGVVEYVKPEDAERAKESFRVYQEEQRRRQAEEERLKQFNAETQRIAAEGQQAYQQAMIQYQNAEMAQRAADNAMQREISRSQILQQGSYQQGMLANQAAATAGEQQYRGQVIAMQQQQANQERRARRPYRALRVRVA